MKIWQRVLLFAVVWVCVLTLPWWLSAILLSAMTIIVPIYLEALFFGFLFDTLYSSNHAGLISAMVLLLVVMFARTRIRT